MKAENFTPFETFPYPVDITDISDSIIYVNPAFERTYGFKASKVIGLPPHFLIPADSDRASMQANLTSLHLGTTWEGVQANVTASGEVIEVYLIGLPLGANDSQQPFGTVYVASAVAQKDRMRTELLQLLVGNYFSMRILPDFRAAEPLQRGKRGRTVMGLLSLGYAPKQVAAMLGISTSTVGVIKWQQKQRRGSRRLAK